MFNYEPVQHAYFFKFPKGALRTTDQLIRVLDEVADDAVPASLYSVMQSGHIEPFPLRADTLVTNETIMGQPLQRLVNADGYYTFLGDIGIGGDGERPVHEAHRSFMNMADAIEYSLWMKTDPVYQESVRHWHRHCDFIEEAMDRIFGPGSLDDAA